MEDSEKTNISQIGKTGTGIIVNSSTKVSSGSPVNTKSLLAFVFEQMRKLNEGEIDANTACAQAKLASQASNILNYELKRTIVEMRLQSLGNSVTPKLREIESKSFSNTMSYYEQEEPTRLSESDD